MVITSRIVVEFHVLEVFLVERSVPFTVQFTLASTVHFMLSMLFPAHETMLDHAILAQEAQTFPAVMKRRLMIIGLMRRVSSATPPPCACESGMHVHSNLFDPRPSLNY
jgi:hypothetical protein